MIRFVSLLAFILLPASTWAQTQTFTVRGTVQSVDQNKQRIVVAGRRYYVGQDCKIWLNYEKASFASVKAHQEVELTCTRYPGGMRVANILKIGDSAEAAEGPKGPQLFPGTAKVGDKGALANKDPSGRFVVLQLVGKKDALIKGDGVTFRLQGHPTEHMAEGKSVDLPGYFKVTGTNTYETGSGASKTVLVIEPVSEEEKKDLEQGVQAKVHDTATAGDAQKREDEASKKLLMAKQLLDRHVDVAKARLTQIVKQFPGTKAANEAEKILEKLP